MKYIRKLFSELMVLIILLFAAFANWHWPLYLRFGDTTVYRFIWLGIFFLLLDIFIEIIMGIVKELRLMGEGMGFSKDIHKLPASFYVLSEVLFPSGKADYVAVGSSGIWLVEVKDDNGPVTFNGDDLVHNGEPLPGLMTGVLQASYALAEHIKKNLKRDIKVAPVIAFSSSGAKFDSVPPVVRGVYISSRQNIISLIENTDFQLVDKNTIEEVNKLLKK